MINRDQLMNIFRQDCFEENLSENDKIEILLTISQTINEEMENLIFSAIEKWNSLTYKE